MDQDTILYGGLDALETMKENLLELEGYKERSSELALKEDQIEKQLDYKEKAISEEVMATIKKRKLEVEASFDEQINKVKARIKKVKAKKDKEKNAQVTERIKEETSDLTEEKVRLKEEMKVVYQKNHIPRILNNSLYHALFMPRSLHDICTILLTLFLVLLIIPYFVVYELFLPDGTLYLVLVYIVTVVLFGGLYLLVNSKTKENHSDAVIDIRAIRAKQAKNKKRIDAIAKEIRKDKDESVYGLEKFTGEINNLDEELRAIAEEKKEAMVEFETKTRIVIEQEIRAQKKKELKHLEDEYMKICKELKNSEEKVKLFSLDVVSKYEKFVGKDMMSIQKIDNLIQIIESGQASTVAEAITILRKEVQAV